MFGSALSDTTFQCETNPTYMDVPYGVAPDSLDPDGAVTTRRLLINSGQPLNDMFKYVATPPATRLSLVEATLHWRHIAPTAPDTLWCHPYFTDDPFVIKHTPDIYVVGNQPKLATKLVGDGEKRQCRLVLLPSFAETGVLVLVNLFDLAIRVVRFSNGELA